MAQQWMHKIFNDVFGSDSPKEKERLIRRLDSDERNPFITIRLSEAQVRMLSAYVLMLPDQEFRAIALYYCLGYPEKRIGKLIGRDRVRGLILYCEDRLAQCMGLGRPIAKWYWRQACSRAADNYGASDCGGVR